MFPDTEDLPDLTKYAIKQKQPKNGDESVARVVDDELMKLGWSENARLSFLGDLGRENSWSRQTIFGGHSDPKNNAFNRGIISWQGDRRVKLDNYLKKEGVYGRHDDNELRGMVRFMDSEMRDNPEWKNIHTAVRNPNISTYDASENLRKYIKYSPDAPYNSPDKDFRVKANKNWATKAGNLGLGKLPDLSGFAVDEDLPDLSSFATQNNQPITMATAEPTTQNESTYAGTVDDLARQKKPFAKFTGNQIDTMPPQQSDINAVQPSINQTATGKPLYLATEDGQSFVQSSNQQGLQPNEIRVRNTANDKGGETIVKKITAPDGKTSYQFASPASQIPSKRTDERTIRGSQNSPRMTVVNKAIALQPIDQPLPSAEAQIYDTPEYKVNSEKLAEIQKTGAYTDSEVVNNDWTRKVSFSDKPENISNAEWAKQQLIPEIVAKTGVDAVDVEKELDRGFKYISGTPINDIAKDKYFEFVMDDDFYNQLIQRNETKKQGLTQIVASGQDLTPDDKAEISKQFGLDPREIDAALQGKGIIAKDDWRYNQAFQQGQATKALYQTFLGERQKQAEANGDLPNIAEIQARADVGWLDRAKADQLVERERASFEQWRQENPINVESEIAAQMRQSRGMSYDLESARKNAIHKWTEERNNILKTYGGFERYFAEQDRIEKEYANRPLARPLEFAKGFYGAVPQAAASILKFVDVARETVPFLTPIDIIRTALGSPIKATEGYAYQLGELMDKAGEYLLPKNPDLQNYYAAGNAFGQAAVQIGLGAVTGGAALPVTLGSAMGAVEQYDNVKNLDIPGWQKKLITITGGVAAVSDAIPFMKFLAPLNKVQRLGWLNSFFNSVFKSAAKEVGEKEAVELTQGALKRMLKSGISAGKTLGTGFLLEGGQELLEKKINDLIASLTYDPKRKVFVLTNDDVHEFIFGGIGGIGGGAGEIALENAVNNRANQNLSFNIPNLQNFQTNSPIEKKILKPYEDTDEIQFDPYFGYKEGMPKTWEEYQKLQSEKVNEIQPERDVTLQAQSDAMLDRKNESAIGVLYTDGERVPDPARSFIEEISTPEGVLHVSIPKLKTWFNKRNQGEEFNKIEVLSDIENGKIKVSDIIGGKVKEFSNTTDQNTIGGTAVVTVDAQSNELNATKISDNSPEKLTPEEQMLIEKQKQLDQKRFGSKATNTGITSSEEIVNSRRENRPIQFQGSELKLMDGGDQIKALFSGFTAENITQDLRDKLWDKVQKGDTTELGKSSNILIAAKEIRKRGGLNTRQEFEKFNKDYFDNVANKIGAELQASGNDLIKRYIPQTSATEAAHEAATSPKNDLPEPTDAQREAGNYKMGHIKIGGLDITVEIPTGGVRKGVNKQGVAWERTLANHYGYIKRSIGADKENIDVFVKDNTPEDFSGDVFIVDQIHPDGKFDEHKVMIGYSSEEEARKAYLSNYAKNWKGLGKITPMSVEEFKKWTKEDQNAPVSEEIANAQDNSDEQTQRKFSSTQVDVQPKLAKEIIGFAKKLIPASEVTEEDGYEDNIHITAKFGLHTNDAKEVEKIVKNFGPVSATLGEIGIFDTNPDFDVVFLKVDSPDLHRLNKLIAENAEVTDTHPTYKPHLTLAYVKKGEGAKYAGNTELAGTEIVFDSLTFFGKDRQTIDIPLGEKKTNTFQKGDKVKLGNRKVQVVAKNDKGYTVRNMATGETFDTSDELTELSPKEFYDLYNSSLENWKPQVKEQTRTDAERALMPDNEFANPIDRKLSQSDKVRELYKLSAENIEIVEDILAAVKKELGLEGKWSAKEPDTIIGKANRPSILKNKPYFDVEHVRDSLRFMVRLKNFTDVSKIADILNQKNVQIVKLDTGKMINPKEWGWRFVGFDLRMPNGQLVEFYAPPEELDTKEVKGANHVIFEKWRSITSEEIAKNYDEYLRDVNDSFNRYHEAYLKAIKRMGYATEDAASADWRNLTASLESYTGSNESFNSSAVGTDAETVPSGSTNKPTGAPSSSDQTKARPDSGSKETLGFAQGKGISEASITQVDEKSLKNDAGGSKNARQKGFRFTPKKTNVQGETPVKRTGLAAIKNARKKGNKTENTIDGKDNSPTLQKARDLATVSAVNDIEGADLGSLLETADPNDLVRNGYLLETASLPVYEIVRRAAEEVEISQGNNEPFRNDAFYLNSSQVKAVITVLQNGANEAVNAGFAPEDAAKLETLAKTIEDAAKIDGSAIVYLFDDAIPHEEWHKAGFQNAVNKKLAERHTPENLRKLASSDVVTKLRDGAFSTLYPNVSDAVAVEEASAWLAGGGRLKLNEINRELGIDEITEDEADLFLMNWSLSFKKKNPNANLDEFAKINEYANRIIEYTKRIAGANRGADGTSEGNRRTDRRGNAQENQETAPSQRSEANSSGRLKERQTILSAEKSGVIEKNIVSGDVRYYAQKSRDANVRAAQEKIEMLGLANAFNEAVTAEPEEGKRAEYNAFLMELASLYHSQSAEAADKGDAVKAQASLDAAQQVISILAEKGTDFGQAISQLANWQKTDPSAVTGYVQKRRSQNDFQKPLTPAEAQVLRDSATGVSDLNKKLAEMQKKINELEEKLARGKPVQKRRNPIQKKIAEDLAKKSNTALEKLTAKFGIEPILQMASKRLNLPGKQPYLPGVNSPDYQREYKQVKVTRNSKGEILAPNGKPSNLNEHQYRQVRTSTFKMFFGDWETNPDKASKVIDKNGEPRVVFHGSTQSGLEVLSADYSVEVGGGVFFSSDSGVSSEYTYPREWGETQTGYYEEGYEDEDGNWIDGDYIDLPGGDLFDLYLDIRNPHVVDFKGKVGDVENVQKAIDTAKRQGNDGIILNNIEDSVGGSGTIATTYAVFRSTQIKSATNNSGNFDEREDSILKSARPISQMKTAQLDADTLQDFADVGANILMQDTKDAPVSVEDFKRQMTDLFGQDIRPHLTEIHALSVQNLKQIKSDAYRARAVEALQNVEGNEDLTLEDLNAIVDGRIQKLKERAKLRGEHKREANKFVKEQKRIDELDDLPSFAKSLFKVADIENKEILVGALLLETGQVKTVNELIGKIRATFPNISPREALNTASLAARARKLAHEDLETEREKLRKEKTEAEKEVSQVKRDRNQAVRQLLNRIKYLENKPPSYSERIGRLYQSALVSAVQTSVNNFITAQGTRKIETAADLGEVLINKTLRKIGELIGKELNWQYDDKIPAAARYRDIIGAPSSEDYTAADVVKHFFSDAIFARSIANSVLDESPMMYEALFGSFASDIDVLRDRRGAIGKADWLLQKVEKGFDKLNALNSFQEFFVRSQEFNTQLQLRLGVRGLNLADIIKNNEIAEKITEEDLKFAVTRALRTTFALKPDKNTNFGKLVNLYKDTTPAVLSPFIITFPNFLYNATKFVSDYAPVIGLAKAGVKAAVSKNDSFGQSLLNEVNPRVISQQGVGWVLFLSALAMVRFAGDDDKWYYLKTPFKNTEGNNFYIDVRGYQPFASMIFLANKLNRMIDGKPVFSDRDAAASETLEALTGLSTRNLTENKLFNIVSLLTFGSEQNDDKDWERIGYLAKQQLGEISGGFLRPLKTIKDIVAQFNDFEAKQPDTKDAPFKQGLARSLPFANTILGLEPRKNYVTGKESAQAAPGLKIFGVSLVNPEMHREIPSKALVMSRELKPDFKSEKDILPGAQQKAQVKGDIYKAMRENTDVTDALKRAEAEGILKKGEVDRLEDKKGVSELTQNLKQLDFDKIGRVYKVADEKEKQVINDVVTEKAENANKKRNLSNGDVETIRKYLPDFKIDLKEPLTLNDMLKPASTDKAVELYLERENSLTPEQKLEFKKRLRAKAMNAASRGTLTDAETENLKKVIPDLQIKARAKRPARPKRSEESALQNIN